MSLTLVQGDAKVPLRGTITDRDTGDPADLTDCDVFFQMRKKDDGRYTINALCEIVDENAGLVRYVTGANDLNNPGTYQAQFEMRFADGTIQTTEPVIEIIVRRQ